MSGIGKAVGNFVGSITGSASQTRAAQRASDTQAASAQQGIDAQQQQFAATQALLAPFVRSGQNALGQQGNLIGLNGAGAQQTAIDAMQNSPAFQALRAQGNDAILQNASATGGVRGGNVQAALAQFSPALLQQFVQQQYANLGGLTSAGLNAAVSTGQFGANTAGNIGNLLNQQGSAVAGGQIAQGGQNASNFSNLLRLGTSALTLGGGFAPIQGLGVLMGPIDYTSTFKNVDPLGDILAGYQVGSGIRNDQQAQQQLALQQQQQKAGLAREQAYQAAAQKAVQGGNMQDFAGLIAAFPERYQALKEARAASSEGIRKADESAFVRTSAAFQSGDTPEALRQADQHIAALTAAGQDTSDAQQVRDVIATYPPEQARLFLNKMGALILHPETVANMASIGTEDTRAAKAPAELAKANADATTAQVQADNAPAAADLANQNVASQIDERSARLGLDRDKLLSEYQAKAAELKAKGGDVPQPVRDKIDSAVLEATTAGATASRLDDLATRVKDLNATGGGFTTVKDFTLSKFGSTDEYKQIRDEVTRTLTPTVLSTYKANAPGTLSDSDLKQAFKGYPTAQDSPEAISSYFRGAAKIQRFTEADANARSEWLQAVGFLGKPKTDIEVDGIKVPAGTTYPQFQKQFVTEKLATGEKQRVIDAAKASPYGEFIK